MAERLIGIDIRMWSHAGIGRYIRELTGALLRTADPARFRLLAYPKHQAEIRAALGAVPVRDARSAVYSIGEQTELSGFSKSVALLHVPHLNAPVFCASRLVVTVHDLIYLKESRFSGSFLGKLAVRTLLAGIQRNAQAVITVSDFTRRDLESTLPRLAGRTRVIPEAASAHFSPSGPGETEAKEKFGLTGDLLLFVGSLKAHKNLPVLLDAFGMLKKRVTDATLVLVGRRDPREYALMERIERSVDVVRYLGECSDEDLAMLYRSAKAVVVPSLWEGFGLTVLEAMASGAPVISSDRASLPEVVGDAGLLFDPTRVDRLSELLYNVLMDRDLRNSLSAKGLERAKRFSWAIAARQTLELYDAVLDGPARA